MKKWMLLIVAVTLIVGCGEKNTTPQQQKTSAQSTQEKPNEKPTFGITPNEFREKYNNLADKVDKSYRMKKFAIKKGDAYNMFNGSIARNFGVLGQVDKKSGEINGLIMLITGGGKDMVKPIAGLLFCSQSINTAVTKEENSRVVMEMMNHALKNIDSGESIERSVGNLKYSAIAGKELGLMFTISPE